MKATNIIVPNFSLFFFVVSPPTVFIYSIEFDIQCFNVIEFKIFI